MDDVNIIICCKLRERVIPARVSTAGSAALTGTGTGYLSNCTEETAKWNERARSRVGARRSRHAGYDYRFSCAFTCEYPRGKVKDHVRPTTDMLYGLKQISCSPGNALRAHYENTKIRPRAYSCRSTHESQRIIGLHSAKTTA